MGMMNRLTMVNAQRKRRWMAVALIGEATFAALSQVSTEGHR